MAMAEPKTELLLTRARLLEFEYEKRRDALCPRATAEKLIRALVSADRTWMLSKLPAAIAGWAAEELGISEGQALAVVQPLVERHLSELGEIEVDLSDTEDGPQKRLRGTYYGDVRVR
jgi:hypothetical protein